MAGHAVPADLEDAVACLVTAFAEDPITGFLLQTGPHYPHYRERVTRFFSLLMRALIALKMPVLVARGPTGIPWTTRESNAVVHVPPSPATR